MNAGDRELAARWLDNEPAPWSVQHQSWTFVLRGDSLDDISFAGYPALRALRFVVRDHDWNTVPAVVASVEQTLDKDGLHLEMSCHTVDLEIQVQWTARLTLADNELRLAIRAVADSAFRRNRIGIIVLHRPDLAGRTFHIRTATGPAEEHVFPQDISPHQPATNIAGLDWADDNLQCELSLRGDVFEMEDQRNWTDASYKTYSTPLELPFPVTVASGDTIVQSVRLSCAVLEMATPATTEAVAQQKKQLWPQANAVNTFPALQLGAGTSGSAPWAGPVLVELDLNSAEWYEHLERAAGTAGSPLLDVRFIAAGPSDLALAVERLPDYRLLRVGVFDRATHCSEPHLLAALRSALARTDQNMEVVAGTRAHFTELNRNLDRLETGSSAITFSITPQMHDRSRRQVIESIPMQRLVAQQAVRMAAGAPVHIGPITMRPRFNAVATTSPEPETGVPDVDPRQQSIALSAWLIASAAAVAIPGVCSLTYFQTFGPQGIDTDDGGSHPVAATIGWLHDIVGWDVLLATAEVGQIAVLVLARESQWVVMAANLQPQPLSVEIGLRMPMQQQDWAASDEASGSACTLTADTLRLELAPAVVVRWRGAPA